MLPTHETEPAVDDCIVLETWHGLYTFYLHRDQSDGYQENVIERNPSFSEKQLEQLNK